MRFVPTVEEHIEAVILGLSDRCLDELASIEATPQDAFRMARGALTDGSEVVTLIADEPLFIFGHRSYGDHLRRFTWTLATQTFYERGKATTRAAKRYLDKLAIRYPGVEFVSYYTGQHPDVPRWYRLLGFRHNRDEGPAKIYAFRAPVVA